MRLRDAAEELSWHDFREENGAVHVGVAGVVAIVAAVVVVVAVAVAVAAVVVVAADADVGADVVGDDVAGAANDDAVDGFGGADELDELDALAAVVVDVVDAVDAVGAVDVVRASPVLCHIPFVSCLAVFAADLAQCLFLADLCHARCLLPLVMIAGAGSPGLISAAHN